MKKLLLTCEEYCNYDKTTDLHGFDHSKHKLFDSFDTFSNLIIYGPCGIGKYTQALQILKRYSPSSLKYERKISFEYNKDVHNFTISDIHMEVDMDMLGCQSKPLWHEIFAKYVDILVSKTCKQGIILCKNFHNIHSELHDNFHSYMRNHDMNRKFDMKFIILTDNISFISNDILTNTTILSFGRPSKAKYDKVLDCESVKLSSKKGEVYNMKNMKIGLKDTPPYEMLCNVLVEFLLDFDNFDVLILREHLYNILIYNLDIYSCVWYINKVLSKQEVYNENMKDILTTTISFLKLYNNNYRPIYHLENYFLFVFNIIHEIGSTESK